MLVNDDLTDVLEVMGLSVLSIQFFSRMPNSMLVAAPALQSSTAAVKDIDRRWATGEGDMDFMLYSLPASHHSSEKFPVVVDYTFLSAKPRPPRRRGETITDRVRVLKQWMAACYTASSSAHVFAQKLKQVAPPLAFEYEAYLSARGGGNARPVCGVVAPAGRGVHDVAMCIPLLVSRASRVCDVLTNTAALYAKAMSLKWSSAAQSITAAEFDFHVRLRVTEGVRQPKAMMERLSVHMEDRSASPEDSFVQFLRSCLDLKALPHYSSMLSASSPAAGGSSNSASSFLDYIPALEEALFRSIREPLHFMKLALHLSEHFGDPLEISPAKYDLDGSKGSALPFKSLSFGVVDAQTQLSFMIGIRYYNGADWPSVGVIASQFLDKNDSLLRMKVKYPQSTEALSVDSDGFLPIDAIVPVIAKLTTEAMSFLATLCY